MSRSLPAPCLDLPLRRIHALGGRPAAFLIRDRDAGGVLVNAPDPAWAAPLLADGGIRYLFLPSAAGAGHAPFWQRLGATVLAHAREPLPGTLPVERVDARQRLTRTIDFLPLPGATPGTCALYLRNLPGVVFAGPALASGPQGAPLPPPGEDALLSALHLAGHKFQWLFWDDQAPSAFGPDAASRLGQALHAWLND